MRVHFDANGEGEGIWHGGNFIKSLLNDTAL